MTYRDELYAAELRIASLESELCAREADFEQLRRSRSDKSLRTRWLLDVFAVVFAIGFFALVNETHPSQRRVDELRQALERAEAETMQAREEGRAALEALRQHLEAQERSVHVGPVDEVDPGRPASHGDGDPLARPNDSNDSKDDEPTKKEASTVELGHGEAVVWVASEPDSQLIVDGVRYGMTPLMVRVPAGSHALAFVSKRGVETRTVTVRAGETERVSVRLAGNPR
jgi:hypothetical protein